MESPSFDFDYWFALDSSWPDALVNSLFRTCWQGGLLLLALWTLCRLLPRLSVGVRHWLWWLACLKLVLSLVWWTPISLPLLPPRSSPAADMGQLREATPMVPPSGLLGRFFGQPNWDTGATNPSSPFSHQGSSWTMRSLPMLTLLWVIWLTGALWNFVRAAKQGWKIKRLLQRATPLGDPAWGVEAQRLSVLMGVRRTPRLLLSTEIQSPLLTGILRPVVVFPAAFVTEYSADEWRMMLAHEIAHLRRRDLWLALVPLLAQSLFFFFPFVWQACREWIVAREAACDVWALRVTNGSPDVYGRMLLQVATGGGAGHGVGALSLTSGAHTLAMRLRFMDQFKRSPRFAPSRPLPLLGGMLSLLAALPWQITARELRVPPTPEQVVQHNRETQRNHILQSDPKAYYTITDLDALLRGQIPELRHLPESQSLLAIFFCYGVNNAGQLLLQITLGNAPTVRTLLYLWEEGRPLRLLADMPVGTPQENVYAVQLRVLSDNGFLPHEAPDSPFVRTEQGEWRAVHPEATGDFPWPNARNVVVMALHPEGGIIGTTERSVGSGMSSSAFLYRQGSTHLLAPLSNGLTQPLALNRQGEVVGASGQRAFLYRSGQMLDLNSLIPPHSGWTLTSAHAINDRGQILGTGTNYLKRESSFLLTPSR